MTRYSIGASVGKKTGKLASSLSKISTGFDMLEHIDEMKEVELQSISDKVSAISDAISLTGAAYEGFKAKRDFKEHKKTAQAKVAKSDYEKLSPIEKQKLSPEGSTIGGIDWEGFQKTEGYEDYLKKYEPTRVETSMLDKILEGEHYKFGESDKVLGRTAISLTGTMKDRELAMSQYDELWNENVS